MCDDWYHKVVLKSAAYNYLNVMQFLYAANVQFLPPYHGCITSSQIPVRHNFLTILLLHCNQDALFLSYLGNTEIEKSLRAAIVLMQSSDLKEGKSLILTAVHSRLNFRYNNGKHDCYGSEHSSILCLFSHVWKLSETKMYITILSSNE